MICFRQFACAAIALILVPLASAQLPEDIRIEQERCIQELKDDYPGIQFYQEGARISRAYGVAFGGGPTAEASAQSFMNQFVGLLGTGDGEFRLSGTQDLMKGKFTAVYFDQYNGSVPVDYGWVTVLVRNLPGNPIVLVNNSTKMIRQIATAPFFTAQQAIQSVRLSNARFRTFTKPQLTVFVGESEEDARLGWKFIADSTSMAMPERFEIIVDALSNQILHMRSEVYDVDVTGTTRGYATPGLKPDQANNPPVLMDLPGLRVNISGGSTGYSDANGNFTLANAGSTAVTVNAALIGRWVNVQYVPGAEHTLSQSVTPPGPANFVFNTPSDDAKTAQINGFIQTEKVHDFAKSIHPTYPGIDVALLCNVGVSGTCNAYYNSTPSINFFPPGGGCPNTCYSTVVWHEYGHFIIDKGHPTAAGDYHEGVADVAAALLGDTPWLGEDFRGQGTGPLRNCINTVLYPCSGEAHMCGQVISGAFWETLVALDSTVGHATGLSLCRSWYLNSILIRPTGITPQITIDVLTLDDDDMNLTNGSPHYEEIATGFGNKNLDAPDISYVLISPVSLPSGLVQRDKSVDEVVSSRWFEVQVTGNAGAVDPASVKVKISAERASYATFGLAPLGSNRYGAWLPIPDCGGAAKYYVEAKDTHNHVETLPSNAPASNIEFVHADSLSTTFADTFETNLGWTVNNTSLTSGAWTRANPNGTFLNGQPANPEDDSNDAGLQCFFTGQGTVGGAVGSADVDGGPTRLVSPTFNLAGSNAVIEFKRWFFNDDGDDSFVVEVSNNNGASWVQVDGFYFASGMNSWISQSFIVSNYVSPTSQVQVRFITSDNPNNSITEAAVDDFRVRRVICDY